MSNEAWLTFKEQWKRCGLSLIFALFLVTSLKISVPLDKIFEVDAAKLTIAFAIGIISFFAKNPRWTLGLCMGHREEYRKQDGPYKNRTSLFQYVLKCPEEDISHRLLWPIIFTTVLSFSLEKWVQHWPVLVGMAGIIGMSMYAQRKNYKIQTFLYAPLELIFCGTVLATKEVGTLEIWVIASTLTAINFALDHRRKVEKKRKTRDGRTRTMVHYYFSGMVYSFLTGLFGGGILYPIAAHLGHNIVFNAALSVVYGVE